MRTLKNSTLVAINLNTGEEIFRECLETRGILNLIANPQYLASEPQPHTIPLASKKILDAVGGTYRSPMNLPVGAHIVHHGSIDVTELKREVLNEWNHLWSGAHEWPQLFMPKSDYVFHNTYDAKLIFSIELNSTRLFEDASMSSRYILPAWRIFRSSLLPILDELFVNRLRLEGWESRVLRLQMIRMPRNSWIKQHTDQGYYSANAHRFHIPLFVPRCVRFLQLKLHKDHHGMMKEIFFKESEVFEINNKLRHQVAQYGPYDRVTLIIDLLDEPVDKSFEVSSECAMWAHVDRRCILNVNVTVPDLRGFILPVSQSRL